MITETEDPTTWIINVINDEVYYKNIDGKTWVLKGTCNACGLCEEYPEKLPEDKIVVYTNIRDINGEKVIWQRKIEWLASPGIPWASREIGFNSRKDIPMTPDLVNSLNDCSLKGKWIDNAN